MTETKEEKKEFTLVEVPTGSALAFEKKDGSIIQVYDAVLFLLNEVTELKKVVLGK
jgi:hypothetical protein